MIDTKTKEVLNSEGNKLSKMFPKFFGKIAFNFFNGKYVNVNIEQSVKNDNLKKGAEQ